MRTKLLLTILLAVALIGTAACAKATAVPGAAISQPGVAPQPGVPGAPGQPQPALPQPGVPSKPGGSVPGQPGAPGPGNCFDDPRVYLGTLKQTDYIEWFDLQKAGCSSKVYADALARFRTYLKTLCPTKACTDPVAILIYKDRTAFERSSGQWNGYWPRVNQVMLAYQKSLGAPQPAPSATKALLQDAITKIKASFPRTVTLADIEGILNADAVNGAAAVTALETALKAIPTTDAGYPVVKILLDGKPADTTQLIPILQKIVDKM